MHAVASYIPWLWHELPDGTIDVTGATRAERDVAAFIDLCAEHGLWFVARPGPFVMAELKNEGLPYRLYTEHPEIVPIGWDGRKPPADRRLPRATYLEECDRWYAAIMPLLAARLQPAGGNVIAVQLDNEIGMLAWVTNSPDLTDHLVADFGRWLGEQAAPRLRPGGRGPARRPPGQPRCARPGRRGHPAAPGPRRVHARPLPALRRGAAGDGRAPGRGTCPSS